MVETRVLGRAFGGIIGPVSSPRLQIRSSGVEHDGGSLNRDAANEILGKLDPQDFQVLKTLEAKGSLDAFELAGEARLSPTSVQETLKKLDYLGLVNIAERPSADFSDFRFRVNGHRLADLSR